MSGDELIDYRPEFEGEIKGIKAQGISGGVNNKKGRPGYQQDPGAHYRYEYRGIKLDPARIAEIYGPMHPMQFTALKKILKAGERGHKDLCQDLRDIIGACERWLEMIAEDAE